MPFYWLFISSAFVGIGGLSDKEVCIKCPEMKEQSQVFQFCQSFNSTHSMLISQSCCINNTITGEEIIGLDWSSCELNTISGLLGNLTCLQELMLENNSKLILHTEDFDGLTNLEYLSLPSNSECPGGNNSWDSTERTNHSVICHTELNLCVDHNITCPNNNSHCVLTAPGKMECLCNPGFYGYKCLRQGHFPTAVYTIVLGACTVVLSVFLWCTQRRKVTKVH